MAWCWTDDWTSSLMHGCVIKPHNICCIYWSPLVQAPDRCQAITWTKVDLSLTGHLEINLSFLKFSSKNINFKMSPATCRLFYCHTNHFIEASMFQKRIPCICIVPCIFVCAMRLIQGLNLWSILLNALFVCIIQFVENRTCRLAKSSLW